jgi:ABC-type antimicrobial peptide transport system permease subunit
VGDAGAVAADVIAGVDPTALPQPTVPFTDHVAAWYAPLTLQLAVVSTLGLVGLVLVAIGLYALVAYQVSLRRREIGIRKALGAPVGGLFRGVVAQGAALSAAGLVVGMGVWYLLVPTLSGLVVGLDGGDLVVPSVVAGVVAVISVLATLAPAWRSSSVDPAVALQAE